MTDPEPPPYPGDDSGLPSYGSVPPPPAGPVGPVQNQKALAALILGLVSIPLMFCCIGLGTGIASLVLGIVGRKEIQASGGAQTGDGMAWTGIIVGIIAIVFSILMTALGIALNLAEFDPDTFAP